MPVLLALALAIALLDVDFRNQVGDVCGSFIDFLFSGFNIAFGFGGLLVFALLLFAVWDRLRQMADWLRGSGARLDKAVYSLRVDDG